MNRINAGNLRKFGLEMVGAVSWGTHLCQFYETKDDLVEVLVPYFAQGLRSNEFCMWVTSPPLEVEEAKEALRKAVPDLDAYFRKGQIETVSFSDWYLKEGGFDSNRVLRGWVEKEKEALSRGFDGLRLTGNTLWVERNLWKSFTDYEAAVNNAIVTERMIALCTYCLSRCSGGDVIDVVRNHVGTLVKRGSEWVMVEDAVQRKESEVLYKNTIQTSIDGFWVVDNKGRFLDVNDSYARLIGYSRSELLTMNVQDVEAKETAEETECHLEEVERRGCDRFETVHRRKDGTLLDFEVIVSHVGYGDGRFFVFLHDITKRKRNEAKIVESMGRLSIALNAVGGATWDLNLLENSRIWSPENYKLFGLNPETLGSLDAWLELVHPEDRGPLTRSISASHRNHDELWSREFRILTPERGVRWVATSAKTIYDEKGAPVRIIGVNFDITGRKKTEQNLLESLEESERRQAEVVALLKASKSVLQNREFNVSARAIFDSCQGLLGATAGYVALLSDDGKDNIVLFLESGGYSCSVDPSLPMPVRGLRAETYYSGKVSIENGFPESEWSKLMPSGHVNLQNVLFAPLTVDERTVGIIGLANKPGGFTKRDAEMALAFGEIASISLMNSQMLEEIQQKTRKLKAYSESLEALVEQRTRQLADSERLAAIGQTAGMVGHDIRNPLQAIFGDVFLAKADLSSCPDCEERASVKESLESIEKNVEYINKIVADLQDFAKPLNPSVGEVDLRQIVEELLSKHDIPGNVEASGQVEKGAEKVEADPAYVKRILGNLVSNAVQAMPDGGKLEILVYREEEDAILAVRDTGVGIPEEVRSRLFTPLFTTKSKGQGFGLAVVKRLAEALKGKVTFESGEGKGTVFRVRLPFRQVYGQKEAL